MPLGTSWVGHQLGAKHSHVSRRDLRPHTLLRRLRYDCRQDSRSGDQPMQAIVYHRYGPPDVLGLEEIPKPTPADGQVLIRVHAASVNPYDWHFLRGTPSLLRLFLGMRRPKSPRLGADVAGIVESVGAKVALFKPGDAVFGTAKGSFAEYACATASQLPRSRKRFRSNMPHVCRSRESPRCKACATKEEFRQVKLSSSTVQRAVSRLLRNSQLSQGAGNFP
jgi:hypothetical protein